MRQDIDDFDGFNNSEDEEQIEMLNEEEEFENTPHRNKSQENFMANIDEEEEYKDEMKQFNEAFARK